MSAERLVIVGGGAAGFAAARGYRAAGGTGSVSLVTAEAHRPYRRPPLTKEYLRGELERSELPLEQPRWFDDHGVRVATAASVSRVDLERRVVEVERLGEVPFDRLVIATGARPARPPIDGADHPHVHTIRTVEDADALIHAAPTGTRVTVVGSGFIGCEAAASLAMRGNDVTLLTDEPGPQAARLGTEVGERIGGWLQELGVTVRLERELSRVADGGDGGAARVLHDAAGGEAGRDGEDDCDNNGHGDGHGHGDGDGDGDGDGETVATDAARQRAGADAAEPIHADAIVLALGIEPNVELAAGAGLELDGDRIACDASGATSTDGVFAAGDVARLHNPTAGRRLGVEHWGEALAQGEIAGRSVAGATGRWGAVPGFWSTIGDRTLKQAAWGDGHDEVRLIDDEQDGWTAWYGLEGRCVGVLTHERDDDYERGRELIAAGARLP